MSTILPSQQLQHSSHQSPSRLPTPRSSNTSTSPSRLPTPLTLSETASPCPSPSKLQPGLVRKGSIAERAKLFERDTDNGPTLTPGRSGFGFGGGESPSRSPVPLIKNDRELSEMATSRVDLNNDKKTMPPPPKPSDKDISRNGFEGSGSVRVKGPLRTNSVRPPTDQVTFSRTTSTSGSRSQTNPRTSSTELKPRKPSSSSTIASSTRPAMKTLESQEVTFKQPSDGKTLNSSGIRGSSSDVALQGKSLTGRPRPVSMYAMPTKSTTTKKTDIVSHKRSGSAASDHSVDLDGSRISSTRAVSSSMKLPSRSEKPSALPSSRPRNGDSANTSTRAPTSIRPASNDSVVFSAKPSFNNFKVEYPTGASTPKPATTTILQSASSTASTSTQTPTSTLHAQTRLLQLSVLHSKSFDAMSSLVKSAETQLKERYRLVHNQSIQLHKDLHHEQELLDLKGLEVALLPLSSSTLAYRPNFEESIRSFSEAVTKLERLFTTSPTPGEYNRLILQFEDWLTNKAQDHVDGIGVEFNREITRVRRKLDTGWRALEGWERLLTGDEVRNSSISMVVRTLSEMAKRGMEELVMLQSMEKRIVTCAREELKRMVDEIMLDDLDEKAISGHKAAWL